MFWNKDKKDFSSKGLKIGPLQKFVMKKILEMDPRQREKMLMKFINSDYVNKNRGKIHDAVEKLNNKGIINQAQMNEIKKLLGIT